jgi:CHAT domain-containing protein/Tfp pilus assembly protein PilF
MRLDDFHFLKFLKITNRPGRPVCMLFRSQVLIVALSISMFAQVVGDMKSSEAKKSYDDGVALFLQGTLESYRAAGENLERAASLYRELGDRTGEAKSLLGIGFISNAVGANLNAAESFKRALALFRETGDENNEASVLSNLGALYSDIGDPEKGLDFLNQALRMRREQGKKSDVAIVLNNIGNIHDAAGENQKAIEFYQEALSLFRSSGKRDGEAAALRNLSVVYSELGEKQKAFELNSQARAIHRELGDKQGEALTLMGIADYYSESGDDKKAIEIFDQALMLFREVGDKEGEATTLGNMGRIYDFLGENQKALETHNLALPLFRSIGNRAGEASTLMSIGSVLETQGKPREAVALTYRALTLFRIEGDKEGAATAFAYLAGLLRTLKNNAMAIALGKQAVLTYQQLRANIQGLDRETQQVFLKTIERPYRRLAESLVKENRLSEAQQILNSFKDQQVFDIDKTRSQIAPALTAREAQLVKDFGTLTDRLGKAARDADHLMDEIGSREPTNEESAQIRKLESDSKANSDAVEVLFHQAEADFLKTSTIAATIDPIPDLARIQDVLKIASSGSAKTVTVYQLIGSERLDMILITPDSISSVSSLIKAEDLNKLSLKYWGMLQSDRYDPTHLSKELYELVFKPLEKELPKDTKTILWSLDGNLRYVPMGALFDGKRYLAERYNHVNFTRADAERMTRAVSAKWTATGLGTSKQHTVSLLGDSISFDALPGVTAEFEQIFKPSGKAGLLDGHVLRDAAFDQKSMLEQMKLKRPVVHIASHFSFRPGDETRSFLLMGDGKAFTLADMKKETNMFAGVELLTLSACNTAAQQADANGREIDGFAELAQRLGANSVMATLWPVADASTPWLMREFYSGKLDRKLSKAESLRQAQLALLRGVGENGPVSGVRNSSKPTDDVVVVTKDGKPPANAVRGAKIYLSESDAPLYDPKGKPPFAHPHYWAPFILFGNWQ